MNEDIVAMTSSNALSNNSSGYTRKVREPDVFNDERDAIVLEAWIYSLELLYFFSLVKIDNTQEKLLVGLSLLRNDAQLWYSQMSAFDSEHTPQDWDELKAALRNEFIPIDAIAKARDGMANLVQVSNVTSYINAFRRLLLQIPDMTPGVAQDKFVRGLKQPLRHAVRSHFPKSLEEAQRVALAIEGAVEDEVVQLVKPNVPQPQYESMDLDAIRELVNAINGSRGGRRNFNAGNKPRNNSNIKCYNCQGWGHTQGECPSPRVNGRGGGKRYGGSFGNKKHLKE
ncbi:CCHC-type zinc finger transcription factor [Mucor lusitanicus CBS 277.49]|uniref:CCHC-type zinc finger transcription factor n=1 Tax=Mucor lusitanicus CBS 277.49 TaxID=747725 RepID=A0A168JTU8_MUCCL|nr:CCHC-type zinc finger transcription factor [Mucor lusitanicus CBS 277.49]